MQRSETRHIIEEVPIRASPVELFQAISRYRYSFFLDSALSHKNLGRYSFMGCDPFLVFKSKGNSITLEWRDNTRETFKSNPFSALQDIFNRYKTSIIKGVPPFTGGGVGYFAYDMKDFLERLPDMARDDLGLPDCVVGFYDIVLICDNIGLRRYLAGVQFPDGLTNDNQKFEERVKEFKEKISSRRGELCGSLLRPGASRLISNFLKGSYYRMVEKAKEYIRRGDIYQVNLSQRFEADLDMEPFELYLRLRDASPAPFSAYLGFEEAALLSSSPERFLLKRGDYIETRPIKGTRPRGVDASSDAIFEKELLESTKDMAEHVMIVDLERNDLGRVSRYGSVRASEFIALERYSNVFHLVSTVSGRLRKGVTPVDCLTAAFPGGSITGAPKIRAMEIIEELEPVKRSVYTGALGYISFDGNMDTSIVIRTFLVKDKKAYFQVGGGIVTDSIPGKEYDETIDKAKGLMDALGLKAEKKETAFA